MGFFRKITRVFQGAVKTVSRPGPSLKKAVAGIIDNPVRYTMGLATGGLSEAYRAIPGAKRVFSVTDAVGNQLQTLGADYFTAGAYSHAKALGRSLLQNQQETVGSLPQGGQGMALNLSGILNPIFGLLGNQSNPYAQTLGQIGSSFTSSYMQQQAQRGWSSMPQVSPVTRVANTDSQISVVRSPGQSRGLTREVFEAGAKVLARLGIPYSASTTGFSSALKRSLGSIASLARRTPSGTIVGLLVGLGLSAFEASLLTVWHSQRKRGRRMNPANAKALRRSVRRIKSFHRLCQSTDIIKSRGRSSARSRCGTCKKSPCRC